MEKILLAGCSETQSELVKKLAGNLKIRVQEITPEQFSQTIGALLEQKSTDQKPAEREPADQEHTGQKDEKMPDKGESLLIFSELTEEHFDRMLMKLREQKAGITYKAVVTPTNRTWNLHKLLLHMEMEKRQFRASQSE